MSDYFAEKEIVDQWTDESAVGKDLEFRAVFLESEIQIYFLDGKWIKYQTDSFVTQLITRLYEENRRLEINSEYSHFPPEDI